MKEIRPDHVAIYIRWSTEDQGEGTTLDVQMDGCKAYLGIQGWLFRDDLVFIDDGYSGGSLERPALSRLRRLVLRGDVDCVVVYKLDRLSRSVVDTVNLVLEEWDDLCHVKSAREAIDTVSQAGKMFFYTLVSYAEWERSLIRERTASGRVRRAQEGRWAAGKPPFGYVVGPDKKLALHGEEAPVVARIFREYLNGKGAGTITYQLNEEGVPFRDKLWRIGAVKRVLENPVYYGELVFGVTRANPRYKKRPDEPRNRRAPEPYVRISGGAPAIVSAEEWNAVQARRRERDPVQSRTGPRAYSSPYVLSAMAKCGRCGMSLIGIKRPGCRESVYYCRGHRERGSLYCDCGMINQPWLDKYVISAAKERFGDALARERFLEAMFRGLSTRLEDVRKAKAAVSKNLSRLHGEVSHVRKLLRSAEITTAEYREMTADIETERTEAQEKLRALEVAEEGLLAQQGARETVTGFLDRLRAFDDLSVEEQKNVLRYFIESLQVYKPKGAAELQVQILWRYLTHRPDEYIEERTMDASS